jgi:hypothetical protein
LGVTSPFCRASGRLAAVPDRPLPRLPGPGAPARHPVRAYPLVWFKGGSEPGVLTVNYLARTSTGQLLVSSLMLASPGRALDEAAIVGEALALARGGIQLIGLDHGGRP